MLLNDFYDIGLYFGFFITLGLPAILLKRYFNVPRELTRKLYHLVITLSIFPLVILFRTWFWAILAIFLFTLIVYPILKFVECSSIYQQIAVERESGEFKRSLIIVQVSMALMIFVFWGLLGEEWKYVAIVAVIAWGFGDAAAALIGKKFGRNRILHPRIKGTKTTEGTYAMFAIAGLAIFLTFLIYSSQPWYVCLSIALLVAPISAVVELFSNGGMDTLTVPISTGLAVMFYMSFFSFLGV